MSGNKIAINISKSNLSERLNSCPVAAEHSNQTADESEFLSSFGKFEPVPKSERTIKSPPHFDPKITDADFDSNDDKVINKPVFNRSSSVEDDDEEESDDDGPQVILPPSFKASQLSSAGQQKDGEDDSDSDDGPSVMLPPNFSASQPINNKNDKLSQQEDESADESDNDEGTMFNRYENLPITRELELDHGAKTVSAVALDSNGSRLVTGGVDYEVRLWDFDGMNSSLSPFRAIMPCENHIIKNLEYSSNAELILVVAANSQAKIIDRNGYVKMECVRGDQYIRDMSQTKGHIGMLNDGCWNPRIVSEFITGSIDGTVRIWNIEKDSIKQVSVLKARNQGGLKAIPNSVNYSKDASLVIAACTDGSIQAWDHRRKIYVNNAFLIRKAHENGSETTVNFSYDGQFFATRGTDETLKLWDIRNTKTCIKSIDNLFNRFSNTDCSFSPDDRLILTGVSLQKGEEAGLLKFFNRDTFELHSELKVPSTSVVRSFWHPKLNQIIISTGNGIVKVYYDEKLSERGAKLCVAKSKKRTEDSYVVSATQIITRKLKYLV